MCSSADTDNEESEDASDDGVITQYYKIEIIDIENLCSIFCI